MGRPSSQKKTASGCVRVYFWAWVPSEGSSRSTPTRWRHPFREAPPNERRRIAQSAVGAPHYPHVTTSVPVATMIGRWERGALGGFAMSA